MGSRGWDDEDNEDEWEKEESVAVPVKAKKNSEWSDEEEEEEEEDDKVRHAKLRAEKEELEKRLAAIILELPHEQPKESKKSSKQAKKLLQQKDDEDRARREEAMRAEGQVSMQRKIEESDFANAQDMFGGGSGGASDGDGKFESWKLTEGSKQELYEDFAMHAAAKITTFKDQFLYLALLRKLIGETTKTLDKDKIKELMLVLTKGRTDFSVIDLMRSLLRDADRDIPAEEISALLLAKKVIAAKPKPGTKTAAPEVKSARVELLKLLIQDGVKDMKPEEMGKVIDEGAGVTLTRDQTSKIAARRAEMAGDPAANKGAGKGTARVADHKSGEMYEAFGSGGGEGWGGGGGTRGDDYDFM